MLPDSDQKPIFGCPLPLGEGARGARDHRRGNGTPALTTAFSPHQFSFSPARSRKADEIPAGPRRRITVAHCPRRRRHHHRHHHSMTSNIGIFG
jgi:hypothetical protein